MARFHKICIDTSVKVSAIWSQPGRLPEEVVTDELISGYDVMPTLLDYTGFTDLISVDLPGQSIVPEKNAGKNGKLICDICHAR